MRTQSRVTVLGSWMETRYFYIISVLTFKKNKDWMWSGAGNIKSSNHYGDNLTPNCHSSNKEKRSEMHHQIIKIDPTQDFARLNWKKKIHLASASGYSRLGNSDNLPIQDN